MKTNDDRFLKALHKSNLAWRRIHNKTEHKIHELQGRGDDLHRALIGAWEEALLRKTGGDTVGADEHLRRLEARRDDLGGVLALIEQVEGMMASAHEATFHLWWKLRERLIHDLIKNRRWLEDIVRTRGVE